MKIGLLFSFFLLTIFIAKGQTLQDDPNSLTDPKVQLKVEFVKKVAETETTVTYEIQLAVTYPDGTKVLVPYEDPQPDKLNLHYMEIPKSDLHLYPEGTFPDDSSKSNQ